MYIVEQEIGRNLSRFNSTTSGGSETCSPEQLSKQQMTPGSQYSCKPRIT